MIRFITFEGGDGSGKTTQLKALESYLAARGKSCLSTREPGGTSLGEHIRQVLLEVGQQPITSATELFLYLADRAQHIHEVIIPALDAGKDRSLRSAHRLDTCLSGLWPRDRPWIVAKPQ